MKDVLLFLCLGLLGLTSCLNNEEEEPERFGNAEWLIPIDEVLDGAGKDGIPSVDNPQFVDASQTTFLEPDNLVVGMVGNGFAKAYAHRILDWHEIVNDQVANKYMALTYCPLTGTAVAWNRQIDSFITSFGVSGKLYNTNLMPYDRVTDSYWSQMRLDCVSGKLINTKIETFPVIETTWETWQAMYPNSLVMTTETGFDRNYEAFPYGDYRTNDNNIFFPVSNLDNRLPAKDRVLAVLSDSKNKIYPVARFAEGRVVIEDFPDGEIIIMGSNTKNFLVAYRNNGLENLGFVNGPGAIIAEDSNGNKVTIAGEIVEGPLAGRQLEAVESILGYYFSLAAFYPDIEIFE